MKKFAGFVDESSEILAGAHAADRSCQDVIEQECGYGKARNERPHGVSNDNVDAATYKHAAAFHVDRPHGEAEQHDGKNEPRGTRADRLLHDAADVEDGRGKVIQDDGGSTPE